jgi:capsular polysaccharide biosynthesis protein
VTPPFELIASHRRRHPGGWHVVHPPSPTEWPPPRTYGAKAVDFVLPEVSSEYGMLEVPSGLVFGSHGWVLTSKGAVFPELSWYGGPSNRIRLPKPLPEPIRLGGTCLSLVSDWSCSNYSHYLLDGLGRLALFLEAGFSLRDVDHIYCPTPPAVAVQSYADRLGVPAEKTISAARQLLVRADVLLVPSLPSTELTYPGWLAEFLREGLVPEPAARGGRRLYVSRSGYGRQAVEEREIERLMREHDFEIYTPSEHDDQPRDFGEADFVVGPHGAGLANLAFCRPGTRVVEILPTDNAHPFYYSLAVSAGLDYGYLLAQSVVDRPPGAFGPSPYDFHVDLEELRVAIA